MEKDKVAYEDVAWMFEEIGNHGYAGCFYSRAWKIFDDKGLTAYSNEEEFIHVYLRAGALTTLVNRFAKVAFEETFWYNTQLAALRGIQEYYNDRYCDSEYEDLWYIVGQIYSRGRTDGKLSTNVFDAARSLIDSKQAEVISALKTGLPYNLATVLFAIVEIDSFLKNEINAEQESISSNDDFWRMVEKYESDINSSQDDRLINGNRWIAEGAPDIGGCIVDKEYE